MWCCGPIIISIRRQSFCRLFVKKKSRKKERKKERKTDKKKEFKVLLLDQFLN